MRAGDAGLRTVQARLLRALAEAGGVLPPREPLASLRPDPFRGAAIADLEAAGLVRRRSAGGFEPGPRGSLLTVEGVTERRAGPGRIGRLLEIEAAVGSTNDVVMERAIAGAPPGLVVAAELQTAGRGRRGRTFDSRPGLGLWCSALLDAPPDPARAPRAALVVGLAVAEAIEEATGTAVGLKWPNDVHLEGRKVCGVLVEARTIGRRIHLVAGFGVNVHHLPDEFPPEIRERAGSLEEVTGNAIERSALLALVLDRLETRWSEEARDALDLPALWESRDELRGRPVSIGMGSDVAEGVADGIDESGGLRLIGPDGGVRIVSSGEATPASRA